LGAAPGEAFAGAGVPRREALALGTAVGGFEGFVGRARAEEAAAGGGKVQLVQTIAESGLEDWTVAEYEAMRDDEPRTKAYEAAIGRRLQGSSDTIVVDIGTGALALLAIMAAKAGAKKVYAIEINPGAAKLAKEAVAKEKLQDKIEVIEGNSMEVDLPEKADLIVSELIGSIATQEGVEPIILDAQRRFLREAGGDPAARMIPARVETRIAPIKYTEHRIMKFASRRGVMSRGKAEPGTLRPLRLRSKTRDLVFLAEPQVMESFDFGGASGSKGIDRQALKFEIPAKVKDDAKDFSGFAMWTRLVVDDQNVVEVRGQKLTSHWAYVVALMSEQPVTIAAPGSIELRTAVDYASKPVRYTLEADCAV